ncbi:MAG: hypothetical protein HJJLKODD_00884 [Phycisphaerae bacterium]|nr:hypothetical protein [Phycisphaerae bacterium]
MDAANSAANNDSARGNSLGSILAEVHPDLAGLTASPETAEKLAQVVKVLVELLSRLDRTILSELMILSKNNSSLKSMAETLQRQGLLNIQDTVAAVLKPGNTRLNRVQQYSQLLLRWWAAMVAGIHSTCEQSSQQLAEALNPTTWPVEKKRWSSEEVAFWQYFQMIIRHELPLRQSDQMKSTQAQKTLEAYTALGGGSSSS